MSWDVTLCRDGCIPFENLDVLREQIISAVPQMKFIKQPSGSEQIETARANGVEFPDVILRHLEKKTASETAEYDGDAISIALYGIERNPIYQINAEVRGQGNPLPILHALCAALGCTAVDLSTGDPIDLSGDDSKEWRNFQEYRDGAIDSLKSQK